MDSTKVVIEEIPVSTTLTNAQDLIVTVNSYFSISVPILSILCVGYFLWKLQSSAKKNKNSVAQEFGANVAEYLELFMIMSSFATVLLFTSSSMVRGAGGDSILRYLVISGIELGFYMFSTKQITEALIDGKLTKSEIISNIFIFFTAVLSTIIMNFLYYESSGVIGISYTANFQWYNWLGIEFIKYDEVHLEIGNIVLIWSTPLFALISNYLNISKTLSSQGGASTNNFRSSTNKNNTTSKTTNNNTTSTFQQLQSKIPANL